MRQTKRKDRVAAFVLYLIAIAAAAVGWFAVVLVCLLFATALDPPLRRR